MSEVEQPRGLPKSRVEALSDGVFAIAMTVLVLGLQVPEGGGASGLRARLWALWPKLASYVLSFVMLGVLWIGHHFQMHYVRRVNRPLLWLNLAFLLTITFLPFSTAILGNYYREPLAVSVYGGTIVIAGTSLLSHWRYAEAHPSLLVGPVDPRVSRLLAARILFGIGLSFVAVALAFVDTRYSLVVLLAMPLVYLLRSRVDLHTGD